jgi:CheY-like chemotaxis protein
MSSSHGLDAPDLKGVRVLVVEDTWHVAKAMKALLERLEMSVLGPTSTTAAARRLIAAKNPSLACRRLQRKRLWHSYRNRSAETN